MREDFLEFKKYYREAEAELPADSFFKQSIDHKFKHSISVLQIGKQIINKTPDLRNQSDDFKKVAQIALLFHDVGRFKEAVLRYNTPDLKANAQILNQYDHGLIGYQKMKDNPRYNDVRILLAIYGHSKMMDDVKETLLWQGAENSRYSAEVKKILYLVRDADKLALLDGIKKEDRLRTDIFFKLLPQEALTAGISEKVKEQFFARRTIMSSTINSFADRILLVLSWIFDFNYVQTKVIFKQKEYTAYLLNLLAQYHPVSADIDEIADFMSQNL